MSQPTDLKQTTPTSTKRNIAVPSTPKKKKSRRNVTENPQMMFDDWLNQFKEMNSMYTNVDAFSKTHQVRIKMQFNLSTLQVHTYYAKANT